MTGARILTAVALLFMAKSVSAEDSWDVRPPSPNAPVAIDSIGSTADTKEPQKKSLLGDNGKPPPMSDEEKRQMAHEIGNLKEKQDQEGSQQMAQALQIFQAMVMSPTISISGSSSISGQPQNAAKTRQEYTQMQKAMVIQAKKDFEELIKVLNSPEFAQQMQQLHQALDRSQRMNRPIFR